MRKTTRRAACQNKQSLVAYPSDSQRDTPMDASTEPYESLIRSAARRLKGHQRRLFQAEVASRLCGGNARAAERRFGWGRDAVTTGLHEARQGLRCVENFAARGARP